MNTTTTAGDKVQAATNGAREGARRALGLGPATTCPICARAKGAPYRRTGASGTIVEGCVDSFHYGAIDGADLAWHERPESHRCRVAMLKIAR